MQITIKLSATAPLDVGRPIALLDLALQPTHPGIGDRELSTYYYAEVSRERCEEVLEDLRKHPFVEAAYASPSPELP